MWGRDQKFTVCDQKFTARSAVNFCPPPSAFPRGEGEGGGGRAREKFCTQPKPLLPYSDAVKSLLNYSNVFALPIFGMSSSDFVLANLRPPRWRSNWVSARVVSTVSTVAISKLSDNEKPNSGVPVLLGAIAVGLGRRRFSPPPPACSNIAAPLVPLPRKLLRRFNFKAHRATVRRFALQNRLTAPKPKNKPKPVRR